MIVHCLQDSANPQYNENCFGKKPKLIRGGVGVLNGISKNGGMDGCRSDFIFEYRCRRKGIRRKLPTIELLLHVA